MAETAPKPTSEEQAIEKEPAEPKEGLERPPPPEPGPCQVHPQVQATPGPAPMEQRFGEYDLLAPYLEAERKEFPNSDGVRLIGSCDPSDFPTAFLICTECVAKRKAWLADHKAETKPSVWEFISQ